jgi:hypothetical protein
MTIAGMMLLTVRYLAGLDRRRGTAWRRVRSIVSGGSNAAVDAIALVVLRALGLRIKMTADRIFLT